MSGGHHLIHGELVDFLTGRVLPDTDDERLRQSIARLLVTEKGYDPAAIESAHPLTVAAGDRKGRIPVDFIIRMDGRVAMVIKYGPGSLVTRRRPALAAARLVAGAHVPVVVATNGRSAEVVAGDSGQVMAEGLSAIPHREDLAARMAQWSPRPLPPDRLALEARIAYAYEVEGACPCDDTVCHIA